MRRIGEGAIDRREMVRELNARVEALLRGGDEALRDEAEAAQRRDAVRVGESVARLDDEDEELVRAGGEPRRS